MLENRSGNRVYNLELWRVTVKKIFLSDCHSSNLHWGDVKEKLSRAEWAGLLYLQLNAVVYSVVDVLCFSTHVCVWLFYTAKIHSKDWHGMCTVFGNVTRIIVFFFKKEKKIAITDSIKYCAAVKSRQKDIVLVLMLSIEINHCEVNKLHVYGCTGSGGVSGCL